MGRNRRNARERGSGAGVGITHLEKRAKRYAKRRLQREVTFLEEWVDKIEGLKTNEDMQELVVREKIGRHGGELLKKLAVEANLYSHAYNKGRSRVHVVSKVPLPNYRADLDAYNGSGQHEHCPQVTFVEDEWVDKIEGLKTNEDMQELVVRENIGRTGGGLLKKLAVEAELYFRAYNKGTNTVHVVSKVPLPNYRADLDANNGSRQREIHMSTDIELRVEHELANFRNSRFESSSTNGIGVSENGNGAGLKRAHLDNDNNPWPLEIQLSTDTELRVEYEPATNFRNSRFASTSTNGIVISENGDGAGLKRAKIEVIDQIDFSRLDKEKLSRELKNQQQQLQASKAVRDMLLFREKLPTYKMRAELLQAVERNQVLVVSGETGCGKTTQLPQFILEHEIISDRGADCNIICTQPRRISAISVASRVAAERGDELGETVGYQIRLESKRCWSTRLLFCTTGVLLRRLVLDPMLNGVSHVLVDEIHERGMNEDFLIIVLRDLLPLRPDLRLVLMSATINAELFSTYFGNAPRIHIPGFTFPVMQLYLEDVLEKTGYQIEPKHEGNGRGYKGKNPLSTLFTEADIEKEFNHYSETTKQSLKVWSRENCDILGLIEASIEYICKHEGQGAILVFLTGWDEISKLTARLKMNSYLRNGNKFLIIPLHSLMPTINQMEIFQRPPSDVRKIVVATNIAETSITIDDIVYVLDCGRCKETAYDALNKLASLNPSWISKASALQRKGRAGRVQPGVCYHLYAKMIFDAMPQYQLPEILRTPLQELCLQIKSLRVGCIAQFLAKALQPPEPLAVKNAVELLVTIGALNEREELTPLGRHLATLPMDPKIGKMLLMGAVFQCLGPALTIASAVAYRSPYVLPIDQKQEADNAKRRFSADSYSDHIAVLRAFEGWQRARREGNEHQFCLQNFLSPSRLKMMEDMQLQFLNHLSDIGFYNHSKGLQAHNELSDNLEIVRAILCAGFFPNIIQCGGKREKTAWFTGNVNLHPNTTHYRGKRGKAGCFTKEDGKVVLHPASVNANVHSFPYPWLVYNEKVRTSAIYIRDSTNISDYAVLMFGGSLTPNKTEDCVDMLEGYLQFSASKRIMKLVQDVRRELDILLQRKIEQPQLDIHDQGEGVVNAVLELFKCDTS